MDLKSGRLFWPMQHRLVPEYPPLRENVRCDVAIVGGGATGALIAHTVGQAGFGVVLLDKREVACGSTSASTALLLYEIDTPLFKLIRMIGRKDAERSYHVCLEAIDQIEQIVRSLPSDCGFNRRQSLYVATHARAVPDLKKEYASRKRAGFRVEYLAATELRTRFGLRARGGILSTDAGEIDPYFFTHRLAAQSVEQGGRVFARTEVSRWEETGKGVVLHAGDFQVRAAWLIVATGYESQCYLKRKLVRLKSTYAIATQPLCSRDRLLQQPLVWEMAQPYHYMRATRDGRIMIGGEDEDFVDPKERDRLIHVKARRLEKAIRSLQPGLDVKAEYAWAGTFGETRDGLPYIGVMRGSRRIVYALCYGANGINFAMIAANLIRDRLLHKKNRDGHLFSLDRS